MRQLCMMLIVLLPLTLAAFPMEVRPMLEATAQAEMLDLSSRLPVGTVVRIDSLCGDTDGVFASLCKRELTRLGFPISDVDNLAKAHTELLSQQDDPTYREGASPGEFLPPTHVISGELTFSDDSRLGKHRYRLRLQLDAQDLAAGVSVWSCDVEQKTQKPVSVWWLPAVFVGSLLLVLGVNVLSRGYLGAPTLFFALTMDVLFLVWFFFV